MFTLNTSQVTSPPSYADKIKIKTTTASIICQYHCWLNVTFETAEKRGLSSQYSDLVSGLSLVKHF